MFSVQNLAQMGLLRMAKERNPADLMTKYVATDALRRLVTHLGVVSIWFKGNAPSDANHADDHVAALSAHCMPRSAAHTARTCSTGRRWTEVHVGGLSA